MKKVAGLSGVITLAALFSLSLINCGSKSNGPLGPSGPFTVNFISGSGAASVPDQTIDNGELATRPKNPVRPYPMANLAEGLYNGTTPVYGFINWYYNDEPWDFNTPVTEDITLTARWKAPVAIDVSGASGHHILDRTINYINNTASAASYFLAIDDDYETGPLDLEKSGASLTLSGKGSERTITLTEYGTLFMVSSGAALILDNNITLQSDVYDNDSIILVTGEDSKLIMNNGSKIHGNSTCYDYHGGGVYVDDSASFEMKGGEISGNSACYGGGVVVEYYGTFTMSGGEISGNYAIPYEVGETSHGGHGGGVAVYEGTFTMSGGTISGNSGHGGSGVYVNSGEFIMSGTAEISGNVNASDTDGGGVLVDEDGIFTMNAGTITGNTASYGGGVSVYEDGLFTMNNGTISGNTANNSGGGVDILNGTFIMNGGAITANTALGEFGSGGVNIEGNYEYHDGTISDNIPNDFYTPSEIY